MAKKNNSSELKITRIYNAPVKIVWDAWTDPKQVAKWWGPRGFTLTTHSKDLRVGGHWRYTMHGPDGTDYPNNTLYYEVEEFKRLVYDHGGNDDQPPLFRVTVEFKELGKKTQMEMTMTCSSPEAAEQIRKHVKEANGNSTWDRLGEYLEKEDSGKDIFIINRSFDAPVETLFKMWTDARHFSKWLAPKGMSMEILNGDIKENASIFYKMTNGVDLTMYGKISYIKVERPNHIRYTQVFCTESGEISRHPLVPLWPEKILTHIFLTQESEDLTRVTVVWEPQGDVTSEDLKAFINLRAGMTQGWTGSFDKLESLIENEI